MRPYWARRHRIAWNASNPRHVAIGLRLILLDLRSVERTWHEDARDPVPLDDADVLTRADLQVLYQLARNSTAESWIAFMTDVLRGVEQRQAIYAATTTVSPTPTATAPRPIQEVVVSTTVVEGQARRVCDPASPQLGCVDAGDPDDAPPHGTYHRYISRRFRCRCSLCRAAHAAYRASNARATAATDDTMTAQPPKLPLRKLACWCGSEKAYQVCHADADTESGWIPMGGWRAATAR